jgi:pilus assembly protein FimV
VALERLLDLCLGAGNDRRTAELAAQLQEIYEQKGDQNRMERFADLQRRFARASAGAGGAAPGAAAAPPPEFAIPSAEAEFATEGEALATAPPVQEGEHAVHELDLSEDWAALANQTSEQAESGATTEAVAVPPAAEAAEPPSEQAAEAEKEAEPAVEQAASEQPAAAAAPPEFEEVELSLEAEVPAAPAPAVEEPKSAPQEEEVLEYDLELSTPPAAAKPAGANASTQELLADLARELDNIGIGPEVTDTSKHAPPPAPPPVVPAAPPSPAAAAASAMASAGTGDHLREVFEEFRAELGEMGEEEEDLETHYNLGIAYREMDLFEESIAEFQKVAKLIQSGRPFRYGMQCYTLLGLAFMDKGEPKIAAMWYQKALAVPGLDQESILALRYDLGVSQELAGETASALDSFTQVYAMNIDYRDVADRIAGLQKRR